MPVGGKLVLKGGLKVTSSGVEKAKKKKKKHAEALTEEEKQQREEQSECWESLMNTACSISVKEGPAWEESAMPHYAAIYFDTK